MHGLRSVVGRAGVEKHRWVLRGSGNWEVWVFVYRVLGDVALELEVC